MLTKTNLLIIGHARHGKDTLAEIFQEHYGFTFSSSSQAAADIFIYDLLKDKYGYTTPEECFENRVNHRQEWYELITGYNKIDKAKLGREIVNKTGCYIGMRDYDEIIECLNQNIFDLIIWVDASKRLPLEPRSSFNIDMTIADIIVDNNDSLENFQRRAINLGKALFNPKLHVNPKYLPKAELI
jgi:dephospho-CoA kinase